ncbi:MAG: IS481 family transposase [Phycisphaerales bacterium]|nr:IS481 family transposase [Phycisphaerales bacterium]
MKLHSNAKTTPYSRRLVVHRVLRKGWTQAEAAEAAGVSVRTVAKWIDRYRSEGTAGLLDRSSAPQRSPHRTSSRIVRRIESLRRRRWTAERIAGVLRMALSTVSSILKRIGLGRLRDLEPKEDPQRYERSRPGELLHIDTKKLGRIGRVGHRINRDRTTRSRGIGWEFAHVCVDDATRLAYVEVLPDERRESALAFLRRAVAWFKRKGLMIDQVMTDNGSAYISRDHADLCNELGIRHLRTRPYTPQTNGKAERFIQTLQREWAYAKPYRSSSLRQRALAPWIRQYNHSRPHRGLARSTPAQRLRDLR